MVHFIAMTAAIVAPGASAAMRNQAEQRRGGVHGRLGRR
jgi:hypothetical protein